METKILKTEKDIIIGADLSSGFRASTPMDAQKTIDAYSQYFLEKDNSDKYRLTVTVNPICTNALFNLATEVVFNEGSNDCAVLTDNGLTPSISIEDVENYRAWKTNDGVTFERYEAIEDTSFSNENIGNAVYHCGYDIFNNHLLRRTDFSVVNKYSQDYQGDKKSFNTIKDYLRNGNGEQITENVPKIDGEEMTTGETKLHMYQYDTLRTFSESIEYNLVEKDGWFGFINPSNIDFENYNGISINKCINNRPAASFIDMYPGRDLFSFIPKYNSARKRNENNWDVCLTYPYSNDYNNELVSDIDANVNGIECEIANPKEEVSNWSGYTRDSEVIFSTKIYHGLSVGNNVRLIFITTGNTYEESESIIVTNLGYNGEHNKNYFSVRLSDIQPYIIKNIEDGALTLRVRVRKIINGVDCKYYLRKFRRIPNFKFSNVYEDGVVTEEEIKANINKDFSSSIKKMAFSKNIYSDDISQITFTDDITTNGLKDNYGRKLTEIYLTVVKANRGHEEWKNGEYGSENVEYSHCFGDISSGFNIFTKDPKEAVDYSIHRICGSSEYGNAIETGITINPNENGIFYGDITEFSPSLVLERELEPIYHRVNTIQRETQTTIKYEELENDDYGIDGEFITTPHSISATFNEGYYYRPHYRIPLKKLAETVKQGAHIRMLFTSSATTEEENTYSVTGVSVYNLSVGEKIRLYKINGNDEPIEGIITEASAFSLVFKFKTDILIDDLSDYFLFKLNTNKPSYAVELNDGSGRYLWREIESFSKLGIDNELYDSIFTNGAHYRYLNINFYLRRQDPYEEYFDNEGIDEILIPIGKEEDTSNVEYKKEELSITC